MNLLKKSKRINNQKKRERKKKSRGKKKPECKRADRKVKLYRFNYIIRIIFLFILNFSYFIIIERIYILSKLLGKSINKSSVLLLDTIFTIFKTTYFTF
jgi:hypothetical protein